MLQAIKNVWPNVTIKRGHAQRPPFTPEGERLMNSMVDMINDIFNDAPPPIPNSDRPIFSNEVPGRLPVIPTTYAQVKRVATSHALQIFRDYHALNGILARFEDVIRKRWVKKTRDQRKKVLLTAWPNMSTTHRPDFAALRSESLDQRKSGTKYKHAYMFPFINLEDLVKAKNLLLLFHSRGHNLPSVFAWTDLKTQSLYLASGAARVLSLEGHTMLLTNQATASTYGCLISHKDNPHAAEMCQLGTGQDPGLGLLVLELQEKLLQFLVQCAQLVLHDLLSTGPTNIPAPLSLPPPVVGSDTEWPSVASVAAEAPYRVPSSFDFDRMKALIDAKRAEAEDYICSLREDPGFFRDAIYEYADHQYEILICMEGRFEADFERGSNEFWETTLRDAITEKHRNLLQWESARQYIVQLSHLRDQYDAEIRPDRKLPSEYEETFCHFAYLLHHMRSDCVEALKITMACSPPLRNHLECIPEETSTRVILKPGSPPAWLEEILWLLQALVDRDQSKCYGIDNLLDELNRFTRMEKRKDIITERVSTSLSNLAVLFELESALAWHQPSINLLSVPKDQIFDKFDKETELMMACENTMDIFSRDDVRELLDKMQYPSERKRTQAVVEKMRRAEAILDSFWNGLDEHFRNENGGSLQELLASVVPPRTLERTPEWVEPILPSPLKDINRVPLDDVILDLEQCTQSTLTLDPVTSSKIKIKTRSDAIDTQLPDEHSPSSSPSPTIAVSSRALKVFSALFHDPHSNPPGEIPWTEFLQAFSSAGFAVQKQYGSAWLFTPKSGKPILFHEPHPVAKIPILVARRHGRRLNRAYEWTRDTFVKRSAMDN